MRKPDSVSAPERWAARLTEAPNARLEIPADLKRERTFEISIAFTVSAVEGADSPWHELRVFADGQAQWKRRIATAHPAPYDGLEMRFRRMLPPGRRLSLLAETDCRGARRLSLVIEAEEC